MKKNVKVCFAGASAVLHSQNGNGHRVAPETKKIFEKKKNFFFEFLDVFYTFFRHFLDVF